MRPCGFDVEHYRETIIRAQSLGYCFYSFSEWGGRTAHGKRTILLRHDVDVSLENARHFAEVEAELGIRATYFLRLHSQFYQLLSPESWTHLCALLKVNHEIGLHYERQFYERVDANHIEMLAHDVAILSSIVGKHIQGCTAHLPNKYKPFDTATVRSIGLAYEGYSPEFTKERKYISDSSRHWREGCLCEWLGRAEHITVLVHPFWWLNRGEESMNILPRVEQGY